MKNRLMLTLITSIIIVSCKKGHEQCDNAVVCVKNTGNLKIAYSWNSNSLSDTLISGESTCTNAGEYNSDPNNQSIPTVYFQTNSATWAIKPTSCNTQKEIN